AGYLDRAVEDGRTGALEDVVPCDPPPFDLLRREHDRVQVADQAGEFRVEDHVTQRRPVRRRDQLDPPAGDGPGDPRVGGEAQFVDDDGVGPMVDDGLEDRPGLPVARLRRPAGLGQRDLQPAGAADRGVRNLTVAADFVARVGDDHPAMELFGQDCCCAAKEGGLSRPGPADHQEAPACFQEIPEGFGGPGDRSSDPECEPNDLVIPVADAGDAVEGALDPGSIIFSKPGDPAEHILQVLRADLPGQHDRFAAAAAVKPRDAAEIHLDLLDPVRALRLDPRDNPSGNDSQKGGDVAGGRHRDRRRQGAVEVARSSRPVNMAWNVTGTVRLGPGARSPAGNSAKMISTWRGARAGAVMTPVSVMPPGRIAGRSLTAGSRVTPNGAGRPFTLTSRPGSRTE